MKKFSKNNYSKKNNGKAFGGSQSKNNGKALGGSQSKNNFKSNKYQEDRFNSSNKNTYERNNFKKGDDFKSKEYSSFRSKEKDRNKLSQTQGRFSPKNSNKDNYAENIQFQSNERNFEDWIWGKHSVFETLKSERPINRIWCTSEIFSSEKFFLLLKDCKSKGVLIEEVTWSRLSQLTYGAVHQGVVLQLASSQTLSLDKLIYLSKSKSNNPLFVALDGITDPHNLGAIIRSAEAFDCKGIIIPQRRSAGLTGTVSKVAAGALAHIPVSRVVNLNRALDELKKNGFVILGLSGDGQVPISDFHQKTPIVVVVGAENKGISLLTQKKCDYLLKIPLKGKTSSLNASVATAISLFYLSNI